MEARYYADIYDFQIEIDLAEIGILKQGNIVKGTMEYRDKYGGEAEKRPFQLLSNEFPWSLVKKLFLGDPNLVRMGHSENVLLVEFSTHVIILFKSSEAVRDLIRTRTFSEPYSLIGHVDIKLKK